MLSLPTAGWASKVLILATLFVQIDKAQAQVTQCFSCFHSATLSAGGFTTNAFGQPTAMFVHPGDTVGVLLTVGHRDNCVGNLDTGENDQSLMTFVIDVVDFGTSKVTNYIIIDPPILMHRGDPDVPIVNVDRGAFAGAAYLLTVPSNATKEVHTSISHGVDTNSICNPGGEVGAISSFQLKVIRPSITVPQYCISAIDIANAVVVTYSTTVSNSGDIVLSTVKVISSQPTPDTIVFSTNTLEAGASVTFTKSYTNMANSFGPLTNTLTVTGVDPLQSEVVNSLTAEYSVTPAPVLKIERAPQGVVLSWPATYQSSRLEVSTNDGINWLSTIETPVVTNHEFRVTWTNAAPKAWFRLRVE